MSDQFPQLDKPEGVSSRAFVVAKLGEVRQLVKRLAIGVERSEDWDLAAEFTALSREITRLGERFIDRALGVPVLRGQRATVAYVRCPRCRVVALAGELGTPVDAIASLDVRCCICRHHWHADSSHFPPLDASYPCRRCSEDVRAPLAASEVQCPTCALFFAAPPPP